MTRRLLSSLLAAALVCSVAFVATAEARPSRVVAEVVGIDLGTLGGEETIPRAMNDRGQVVGLSQVAGGQYHAFLWQNGVMTDLTPDFGSQAYDVNNRGQILGTGGPDQFWLLTRGRSVPLDASILSGFENDRAQVAGSGLQFPYFWERGAVTALGPVPGFPPGYAVALSDRGTVLVRGFDPSDDAGNSLPTLQPAYVWTAGVVQPVTPEMFPAADINNRGIVAGTGAQGGFTWRDGMTTLLGAPRGADSMTAVALNNRLQVAGTAAFGETSRAFVWRGGRFTDLGTPAGAQTTAAAINERGDVAGSARFYRTTDGVFVSAAFLASNGRMTILSAPDDRVLQEVVDVNEHGQVLGMTISFLPATGSAVGIRPPVKFSLQRAQPAEGSFAITCLVQRQSLLFLMAPVPAAPGWAIAVH